MDQQDLKEFIRELIVEEFSPKPVELAQKWQGGSIILRPGNGTQEKEIPMDIFLRKVLGVRDSLRVLEQKLNSSDLSAEDKASFHSYITKAYGSLTTFNVLFKDGKDKFVGSGGKGGAGSPKKEQMTIKEAKDKLGLNEY